QLNPGDRLRLHLLEGPQGFTLARHLLTESYKPVGPPVPRARVKEWQVAALQNQQRDSNLQITLALGKLTRGDLPGPGVNQRLPRRGRPQLAPAGHAALRGKGRGQKTTPPPPPALPPSLGLLRSLLEFGRDVLGVLAAQSAADGRGVLDGGGRPEASGPFAPP